MSDDSALQSSARAERDLGVAVGGWTAGLGFAIGCLLLLVDVALGGRSLRLSLYTYVAVPAVIGLGLAIVAVALLVGRLRGRHRSLDSWPGLGRRRGRVLLGAGLAAVAISVLAGWRGVRFSESDGFCGVMCHQVMTPEARGHRAGVHRDTRCAECHVADGVGGFVRAKLYGLEEAYLVVSGSYRTPIATPVSGLPPVADTCAACHHPARPVDDPPQRVRRHYGFDDASTPYLCEMRMKLGGDDPTTGEPGGIHWHASPQVVVRYYAADRERSQIPWIEVDDGSGQPRVYRRGEAEPPASAGLRVMDCTDCHNRTGHDFGSPAEAVDAALAAGALDPGWPAIKRVVVAAVSARYPDLVSARREIDAALRSRYRVAGDVTEQRLAAAIATAIDIYQRSSFPGFGVDAASYPDQMGHLSWPGCFRCHDGEHRDADGEAVSGDCQTCHEILHQARGDAIDAPADRHPQPFQHPGADPDLHVGVLCTDCHGDPASAPAPAPVPVPAP